MVFLPRGISTRKCITCAASIPSLRHLLRNSDYFSLPIFDAFSEIEGIASSIKPFTAS